MEPREPDRRHLARKSESPSSPGLIPGAAARTLPADLVERSARRLGWLALGYAVTQAMVFLLGIVVQPGWVDPRQAPRSYSASIAAAVIAGFALCALAWSRKIPAHLMLDFGLVFEVLGGLFISLAENAVPWPPDQAIRGNSSMALWVAFFALIIPATMGKAILATLATVAMGPIGLAVHVVLGNVTSPVPTQWFILFLPTVLLAGCSVAISRFLYRLGAQVSRAREMGSYQLVDLLGRGGMGEVWRARHRMLARSAAIKLIRTERLVGSAPGEIEAAHRRFEREARATAALHSPHTVALYDYGVSEDGAFYYVMELLDGIDLEALVARFGRQPAARVVHLLRQACDSLAEAHALGLTHRDVKPRNILACRLGVNHDFVKVLDFGLVKMADAGLESRLTIEGTAAGTPAYMAPECALGAKDIDARADLYSLGCVAYWLLTGRLVFEADNAMAMALAHVQSAAVPPSKLAGDVPADLERVVLACLEKDRERRPQSARQLDRMLAGCTAGATWTREQAEQWWNEYSPGDEVAGLAKGASPAITR